MGFSPCAFCVRHYRCWQVVTIQVNQFFYERIFDKRCVIASGVFFAVSTALPTTTLYPWPNTSKGVSLSDHLLAFFFFVDLKLLTGNLLSTLLTTKLQRAIRNSLTAVMITFTIPSNFLLLNCLSDLWFSLHYPYWLFLTPSLLPRLLGRYLELLRSHLKSLSPWDIPMYFIYFKFFVSR